MALERRRDLRSRGGRARLGLAGVQRSGEVLGHEADGHAAFADRRGDHLGRARTHIPHREDAWPARLDQEGSAPERVPRRTIGQAGRERRAGEHEPIVVESDLAREPLRARFGTDEHDHATRREGALSAGPNVCDGDPLQVSVAAEFADLVREQDLDIRLTRDAVAEVAGHGAYGKSNGRVVRTIPESPQCPTASTPPSSTTRQRRSPSSGPSVVCAPDGHVISTASACRASPRPKCCTRLCWERYAEPAWTSRVCQRSPARSRTRAPTASRFERVPTRTSWSQCAAPPWLRRSWAG